MEKERHVSIEYLSKDILDEDFLKNFENFQRFQFVLGSCRVVAKDRFVTAPTALQKLYTIFVITYVIFGYYLINQYDQRFEVKEFDEILYKGFMTNSVLFYTIDTIHLRFFFNRENAKFYVKLYQLDRFLKTNYVQATNTITYYYFVDCPLDLYLRKVFDAFETYQELYRFQILLFTGKAVFYVIAVLRMSDDFLSLIIIVTMTILDILGILFFCYHSEVFQRQLTRIKRSSIGIMSVYQSGPLRDKAKKIYELIEYSPPCFSVFDIWQVRADTFIGLCRLITTLLVTILQFEFL
ncbi:uncharacterized protein LOC132902500 [Amyelois transitella]|uniref:uncharacterized protein LOC132902500 n=1 Tax=Amyelois transitella TaxID=680683 RepID=UPI00298F5473|nr:uncharacterized protein LOC132902500 [Amyelois transitella]